MSRRGNCHDNAVAESFFQLLKRDRIRRQIYSTRDEARADVFNYIETFYNAQASPQHCWQHVARRVRAAPFPTAPKCPQTPGRFTRRDRKSTRLNPATTAPLVCRLLLEKNRHKLTNPQLV